MKYFNECDAQDECDGLNQWKAYRNLILDVGSGFTSEIKLFVEKENSLHDAKLISHNFSSEKGLFCSVWGVRDRKEAFHKVTCRYKRAYLGEGMMVAWDLVRSEPRITVDANEFMRVGDTSPKFEHRVSTNLLESRFCELTVYFDEFDFRVEPS